MTGYIDSLMITQYCRYTQEFEPVVLCSFIDQIEDAGIGSVCDVQSAVATPPGVLLLMDFEDQRLVDRSHHGHVVEPDGNDISIIADGAIGSYSLYLDSSSTINNYLVVEEDSPLAINGDFTIETWVYFIDDTAHSTYYAYQDILASENYACLSGEGGSFVLRRLPSGNVEVRIYDVGSSCSAAVDTPDGTVAGQYMEHGVWYHIAFVRSGTGERNCHVYVDGAEWLTFTYVHTD